MPTTVAQIQLLLSLQASIIWPSHFLPIWMDFCLKGSCGICKLVPLQTDFLCMLWTSCGLVAPVPYASLCSDLSPPLKGQFHRKQNFYKLFSSSEGFFSVKISTILEDVLLYPPTGRRTLLVLLTSSTFSWGVFFGVAPTWMIDCTNFVPLSFPWSWSLYIESSPSSPRTSYVFLRSTLVARGRIFCSEQRQESSPLVDQPSLSAQGWMLNEHPCPRP